MGRGMALEASADRSIFLWLAPENLHLVNWGTLRQRALR